MLNNEQRKHLATTLRNLGFGAFIPVALKIYGSGINWSVVILWIIDGIWSELLALRILECVKDD